MINKERKIKYVRVCVSACVNMDCVIISVVSLL